MIALPRTPTGRIALAIGLSLLVHAIMLFAPMVRLQPSEPPLPPLIAKLEPLPNVAVKPKPVKKPKPKPVAPEPAPVEAAPAEPQPAEALPVEPAPSAVEAAAEPDAASAVAAAVPDAASAVVATAPEESKPAHPLPKHAQLTFVATMPSGLEVAEARYRLDIADDRSYTLTGGANTTGLVRLFKSYEMIQRSSGTVTAQGLRPDAYSVTRNSGGSKDVSEAKFDWQTRSLTFSNGKGTALPELAQDDVSYLYQLSQLPLAKGLVELHVVRNERLIRYELSVGEEEEIQTRLGKLRALPLRKVRAMGEEGLDIWLGLEYRLLPVKVRHFNRAGQVDAEMVIADIRVADE